MDFKAARKAAGLTLAQSAEVSGYSIGAINGHELHAMRARPIKKRADSAVFVCFVFHG